MHFILHPVVFKLIRVFLNTSGCFASSLDDVWSFPDPWWCLMKSIVWVTCLVIQTTKWKHERNLTLPDALGPCNFFSWIEFQIGIEVNHTDLVVSYVIGSRYGSKAGLNRSKLDLREQVWE